MQTYNDMTIWTNADFLETLTYYEPNGTTPINLTGFTGRMDVRSLDYFYPTLIVSIETTNGNGSGSGAGNGYMTLGNTAGTITLDVPLAVTSTLPVGLYAYDIVLVSGSQQRVFGGTIPVCAGVTRLAGVRPQAAELVKLRFFSGLTVDEAAPVVGVSPRTARRLWVFARAWLRREMASLDDAKP